MKKNNSGSKIHKFHALIITILQENWKFLFVAKHGMCPSKAKQFEFRLKICRRWWNPLHGSEEFPLYHRTYLYCIAWFPKHTNTSLGRASLNVKNWSACQVGELNRVKSTPISISSYEESLRVPEWECERGKKGKNGKMKRITLDDFNNNSTERTVKWKKSRVKSGSQSNMCETKHFKLNIRFMHVDRRGRRRQTMIIIISSSLDSFYVPNCHSLPLALSPLVFMVIHLLFFQAFFVIQL